MYIKKIQFKRNSAEIVETLDEKDEDLTPIKLNNNKSGLDIKGNIPVVDNFKLTYWDDSSDEEKL